MENSSFCCASHLTNKQIDVNSTSGQRLRRWPSVEPTSVEVWWYCEGLSVLRLPSALFITTLDGVYHRNSLISQVSLALTGLRQAGTPVTQPLVCKISPPPPNTSNSAAADPGMGITLGARARTKPTLQILGDKLEDQRNADVETHVVPWYRKFHDYRPPTFVRPLA